MKSRTSMAVCLVLCLIVLGQSSTGAEAASPALLSGRKLLQRYYPRNQNNPNLAANTVRAQAATSQAIEQAVNDGASVRSTRQAGTTGALTSWATGQRQSTFDFVEQVTSPTYTRGR